MYKFKARISYIRKFFHIVTIRIYSRILGNYIRRAVKSLQQDYVLKVGLNAVISGKLPIGGLSSLAAVTTTYLKALCDENDIEVSKMDVIMYSHWVETEFVGLKNGILD